MSLNIVLVEPEIPQNTGNIARSCAATGTALHLVRPLGFSLDSKYLKRAGLDYWDLLDVYYYDSIYELLDKYGEDKFYYATTKGDKSYTDMEFADDCFLVFGKETAGLPKELLDRYKERTMRIPMVKIEKARSLNLSNSVAIILYEALRQTGFVDLL